MVQVIQSNRTQRKARHPQHRFYNKVRPWQIQPFMIAPVLPGETLKNVLFQARVVSDPVKNPLIGWWCEYYFFYVKHRDLSISDKLQDMVLQYGTDMSSIFSAASVDHYHQAGSINYSLECLKSVTEHYFREEGEAWNSNLIGNMPVAKINVQSFLDSLTDTNVLTAGGTITTGQTAEVVDKTLTTYEFMRANQLVNMSYEDFLATYGVKKSAVEEHKPELVRYVKEWSYPTNTVDPTTGAPTSALSWSIAERADKDRYFQEPGFLYGVSVIRPKVYLSKQKSSAVDFLDDALTWMPAIMKDNPETSLKEFANNAGPLAGNQTNGYWLDLRDLFMYGDQFTNQALNATDMNFVALPTVAGQTDYASATDADALFVTPATANFIRMDGVATLNILGTQMDYT